MNQLELFPYDYLKRQCSSCKKFTWMILDNNVVELSNVDCVCERTAWMVARRVISSLVGIDL